MCHLPKVSLLLILAVLASSPPASSALLPGDSLFELSPALPSTIVIDLGKLGSQLCQNLPELSPDDKPNIPSQGEWVLKIGPPANPTAAPPRFSIGSVAARSGRSSVVSPVQEISVVWPAAPFTASGVGTVPSPCGPWTYELVLESQRSMLTLLPASAGAAHGDFAGILRFTAWVRYSPAAGNGPAVELPLNFSLFLEGPWVTLAPSAVSSQFGSGTSNLILFAQFEDGVWIGRPACALARDPRTRLCFQASEEALKALNAGRSQGR